MQMRNNHKRKWLRKRFFGARPADAFSASLSSLSALVAFVDQAQTLVAGDFPEEEQLQQMCQEALNAIGQHTQAGNDYWPEAAQVDASSQAGYRTFQNVESNEIPAAKSEISSVTNVL